MWRSKILIFAQDFQYFRKPQKSLDFSVKHFKCFSIDFCSFLLFVWPLASSVISFWPSILRFCIKYCWVFDESVVVFVTLSVTNLIRHQRLDSAHYGFALGLMFFQMILLWYLQTSSEKPTMPSLDGFQMSLIEMCENLMEYTFLALSACKGPLKSF